MSNFNCKECGTPLMDSRTGYFTGCEHYPADRPATDSECVSIYIVVHVSCLSKMSENLSESWIKGRDLYAARVEAAKK
jgi:ssDNA-binding Zn-finger/Zn-ribbon topoisomerase 1